MHIHPLLLAYLLFSLGFAADSLSDELPHVTPYRPTISNPAELPVPLHLEMEAGFEQFTGGDIKQRLAAPVTLKFAFNRDWGLLLNTGWNRLQTEEDASTDGWNPTLLLLKVHHKLSTRHAVGFELGAGSPSDEGTLNRGKLDLVLTGIYSMDIGQTRLDANFGLMRIGKTESGIDRHQYQWALALSKPISDDWSIAGEFSGFAREGLALTTQALICLAYTINRTVVVDFGLAGTLGGNNAATKNIFTGVSVLYD